MTAKQLQISSTLSLPIDFVTKTCAILAQRRKGKTYTASVLAEELYAARVPFVALDPTGAWWGLRSSADGNSPGLPVVVLGGQHGDIPLERTAGRVVADLVVDSVGWYVIDFSLFESGAAERQFATDFAERLYRRKGEAGKDFPLHLFVDEADRFVPQQVRGGKGEARETDQRLLGAFEAIVRRGGLRALGTTLISQRAAVVNKNVLEMLDLLIVLRNVGPNDRKAIEDYLKADADDAQRIAMMGSLAALDIGEAWVWEPGGDPPLFDRIRIRARRTFNSSATPKVGTVRVEPKRLADVDLEQLRERMAATIERAKADDPNALRARIAQLEKERAQERAHPLQQMKEVTVEVPILSAAAIEDLRGIVDRADAKGVEMLAAGDALVKAAQTLNIAIAHTDEAMGKPKLPAPPGRPAVGRASRASDAGSQHNVIFGKDYVITDTTPNGHAVTDTLNEPRRKILDTLDRLESVRIPQPLRSHVAFFAGVSPNSSGFDKNVGILKRDGYVTFPAPGRIAFTPKGRDVAAITADPPTSEELQDQVMALVSGPQGAILRVLIACYPEAMPRAEVAARAGVSETSSGFDKNVGRLRALGFIDYPSPGSVVAESMLFVEQPVGR